MKIDIVNVYCDESHPIQNDGQDFMVIGALICHKKDYKTIKKDIQNIKRMHGIDLDYEFKWQKVNRQRYSLYADLINYIVSSELLNLKINVSLGKNNLKFYGENYGYSDWYHGMYSNMLKNYLELHKTNYSDTRFDLYIDRKETLSDERYSDVAETLTKKFKKTNSNFLFTAKACDSKEFLLIQCVDVIIGAVSYFQRHNFANKYKTQLMEHIAKAFDIVLGQPTRRERDKVSLYYWKPKRR